MESASTARLWPSSSTTPDRVTASASFASTASAAHSGSCSKPSTTLKARGIHLLSLEERLDTSSAAGELVFHVFGAIAHFERRLISERTRDGIAAARKRGRTPGRPPLDPDTVSAAQKLIEAGLSPARTAKQLGIGRATAYRIAKAER